MSATIRDRRRHGAHGEHATGSPSSPHETPSAVSLLSTLSPGAVVSLPDGSRAVVVTQRGEWVAVLPPTSWHQHAVRAYRRCELDDFEAEETTAQYHVDTLESLRRQCEESVP